MLKRRDVGKNSWQQRWCSFVASSGVGLFLHLRLFRRLFAPAHVTNAGPHSRS